VPELFIVMLEISPTGRARQFPRRIRAFTHRALAADLADGHAIGYTQIDVDELAHQGHRQATPHILDRLIPLCPDAQPRQYPR